MRRILPILVLFLCIALLTLPAAAATGKGGNSDEAAGPSGGTPGQPQVTSGASGPAETAAGQARETIRQETRLENQAGGTTGDQARNRTEARVENQTKMPPGQNVSQARETIRLERQQMNGTLSSSNPPGQQRNKNQNEVRLAVHTLLAMENITGGIGPQVSAIARDFNNSVQSTWQYEDRIQSRNPVSRLLFGGDRAAATDLNNLTVQNENRIRQIEQLMNAADLDSKTRAMLEEQLHTMEQENTRLSQVAATEQQDTGIFGWIGK